MKPILLLIPLMLLMPMASALSITLDPPVIEATPGNTYYSDVEISGTGNYTLEIASEICQSVGSGCEFDGNEMVSISFNDTGTGSTISDSGKKTIKIVVATGTDAEYSYKVFAYAGNENASVTGDVNIKSQPVSSGNSQSIGGYTGVRSLTLNLGEQAVRISFKKSVYNPFLSITQLSDTPISEDLIYQYFEITKRNFNNSDIANATIDFRVNNSWILENNITDIYLEHYKNNAWTILRTELISSTPEYSTYRAYTDSFSYFAIAGKKKTIPAVITPEIIETARAENNVSNTSVEDTKTPTGLATSSSSNSVWIIAILGLALILYFLNKRNPKSIR